MGSMKISRGTALIKLGRGGDSSLRFNPMMDLNTQCIGAPKTKQGNSLL